MHKNRLHYILMAFCLAFLGIFLVWPVLLTVSGGFWESAGSTSQFTLKPFLMIFVDPVLRQGLLNSLLIATAVTLLCLLIATPLGMIATKYSFRGKTLMSALILVPMILPPFVGAIGLRQMLGRFGSLNAILISLGLADPASPIDFLGGTRIWGVIIVEALHLYPIVYLNVTAALANLDPAMEQAAANLGASRFTRIRRIIFPLIRPGVFAGATIVFIWAFTELGTPLMFDFTTVTPVQIFWGIQEIQSSARPYALVMIVLVITALLYIVGKLLFGRGVQAMTTRAATAASAQSLRGYRSLAALAPFALVTFLAILPHLGVIITSFAQPGSWYQSVLPAQWTTSHYTNALTHPLANGSIQNSLFYSVLAMGVDVILGLIIAYLLVRTRLWGVRLLDALSMLPLAVPGLVMAFGYVAMSLQIKSWITGAGLSVPNILQIVGENPNPTLFLVIAYAVRRLPYVVRSAAAGLEQTPYDLEEAALNLGASRFRVLRKVVMPLILANLIAGGLLAFSFAMLEVSDSLILAQTQNAYPITKAIYVLFDRLGDGPYIASAMGVWGMALLTITLVGASMILGKKMGAIFRV